MTAMDRRIFGLEIEYGVTCTFRGQRRLSPDEVAHGQRFVQATYYWDTIAANWVCVLSTVTKRNAQYDLDRPDPQHMPPWLRTLPSTRVWDDYRMSYTDPAAQTHS
jgi:hypothetical protein